MRKLLPVLVLLPALALAGCASPQPAASEAPSSPAVESPSPTSEPAPDESPTPDASAPPAGSADITPQVAYDLCKQQIEAGGYLAEGDPAKVTYAPFEQAVSVIRDDGYVGIYIEVTDGNNVNQPESALECVVGGTAETPDWYTYGIGTRADSREEIEESLRLVHSA